MKGMDEARALYESFGKEMIRQEFSDYESRIAVGLVGQGSECFGFDDEISRDHDFGNRFCLWLTKEDFDFIGADLAAAYERNFPPQSEAAAARSGVMIIEDFYQSLIGLPHAPSSWREWFSIPEYALATAVNGEVFKDDLGQFSAIREKLQRGFPRDVFLKKLAAHLALTAQSGQYNYFRCIKRGEYGAAALAIHEFLEHGFHCLFLLNNRYLPFYKWRFKAAEGLTFLSNLPDLFLSLLNEQDYALCGKLINRTCMKISNALLRQGLIHSDMPFLENAAKELMKQVENHEISALHLMEFGAK